MTSTSHPNEEIDKTLGEVARVSATIGRLNGELSRASEIVCECLSSGHRLIVFGNGGSASQAQHMAAELVGRFERERRPLAVVALSSDTSVLTAIGNDYGFQEIFARQLRALARPGDVVLAITTSGNSPNVLRAIEEARELNLQTIGLTGRRGEQMRERVDICLPVSSDSTARVQEAHLIILHILCALIEARLFSREEAMK